MTKSFPEIAWELTGEVEREVNARSFDQRRYNYHVSRDTQIAIEAILRREFGDNNGPALERKVGATTITKVKIDKKKYII